MIKKLGCTGYLSNKGSHSYVNLSLFKEKKISHYFCDYHSPIYKQYSNTKSFEKNLTVFDMLFFCGRDQTIKMMKLFY